MQVFDFYFAYVKTAIVVDLVATTLFFGAVGYSVARGLDSAIRKLRK